jgi:histidine decarboxylase
MHLNNIGDPFVKGNFTVNTKFMERAVLNYFAKLWHAKLPHNLKDVDSYWGYVLTMGSTEGNLYGLWNARDYLSGKVLLCDPKDNTRLVLRQASLAANAKDKKNNENAFSPVVFFSEDTHYSIVKIMRILSVSTFKQVGDQKYPGQCPLPNSKGKWPEEVPSAPPADGDAALLGPGSIDIHALATLVEFFAERGHPILVVLNYGTTFKGAYDDVEGVGKALEPILRKHGLWTRDVEYAPGQYDTRDGYWIHVDGALGATYMPFLRMHDGKKYGPRFDFELPWVHSISTSGHKWIGAPFPTGLYMTKVKYEMRPPDDPEYIGSPDSTLAGSRGGLAPAVLWDFIATHSRDALIERAMRTEELADYAHQRLLKLQAEVKAKVKKNLWVQRTPHSLTVLFRQPRDYIIEKYSLSCETLKVGAMKRSYAHIYMMPHATRERIDDLIRDLEGADAFDWDATEQPAKETNAASAEKAHDVPLMRVSLSGRGWR